ncbi:hypothetical protein [Paenarthrobacter sp. NPDC018779]|uniref:hypothetical protein n=1 Tax=Paenarthrobacter sp. NPDC018779 TaxID=3364375 RepID=UPI0037C5837F
MDSWYRPPGVAFEYHGDSVYVLDLRDVEADLSPRALQGPAALIWSFLGSADNPRPEDEVLGNVADDFGIAIEDIRTQTVSFLLDLERAGLAQRIEYKGRP